MKKLFAIIFISIITACPAFAEDSAYHAFSFEEESGTVLTNSGTSGIDGYRSEYLTRVDGVFTGRYATKGNGVNICTTLQDNAWRNYWTVDFFVKFTAAELVGANALFGRYTSGYRMLSTWCDSGKLWIYCTGAGVINTGTASAVIMADTWHHVRYTYGSAGIGQGTATISVDGVQVLSVAGVGELLAPDGAITILGVIDIAPASVFRGTMADFRFYNSQLPAIYDVPTTYYAGGVIPEPDPDDPDVLAALNSIKNELATCRNLISTCISIGAYLLGLFAFRLIVLAKNQKSPI